MTEPRTLIAPVVHAIENLTMAAWAAPDRGTVADYIGEARDALTLALADEDVRGWAVFMAHRRCHLALRALERGEEGKAGRRTEVVSARLTAASTALVRCAEAHLSSLTWDDALSGSEVATLPAALPKRSQPRTQRSSRGKSGGQR